MGGLDNSEQQYSLRWNDFHSSILSSFRHLRDEEDFVDVTLACDGCSFTAHKVVLSACSPYFRSLLKANPCQHPIVILRDVREQDMEALLRFMYNGEVHIGQEQLTDFLKTAQTLQVRGLADVPTKDHQKLLPNQNLLSWSSGGTVEPPPLGSENHPLSPPPAKRSRSADQPPPLPLPASPSPATLLNNNNNSILVNNSHSSPVCETNNHRSESLLSQALETSQHLGNGPMKGSDSSAAAHSTGEESNSSDMSERGGSGGSHAPLSTPGLDLIHPKTEPQDYAEHSLTPHTPHTPHPPHTPHSQHHNNSLNVLDPSRTPNFPAALLGLQGLLPGPSGMHNNGQDNSFDGSESTAYECPLCAEQWPDLLTIRTHIDEHYPRDSPVCPVPACRRVFAHPNSVRNHMRQKHAHAWLQMKRLKWTYV